MSTNPTNLIPMRVWSDVPTPTRREVLWIKEGKKCHFCGKPTRLCKEGDHDQATTEHLIPRGNGGTNDEDNLASSCLQCNQRRNHEDILGLTDGALLGKQLKSVPLKKKGPPKNNALTADEKKSIISGTKKVDTIHLEQRDQALDEITRLRKELKEKSDSYATLENELNSLKSITVWSLIRRRIAEWINPKN